MSATPAPTSRLQRFLNGVERAGNALPHPATLFLALAAAVVVLSWILHTAGVSAVHPGNGKTVAVVNLLSLEGMHRMLLEPIRTSSPIRPWASRWCACSASASPNTRG